MKEIKIIYEVSLQYISIYWFFIHCLPRRWKFWIFSDHCTYLNIYRKHVSPKYWKWRIFCRRNRMMISKQTINSKSWMFSHTTRMYYQTMLSSFKHVYFNSKLNFATYSFPCFCYVVIFFIMDVARLREDFTD